MKAVGRYGGTTAGLLRLTMAFSLAVTLFTWLFQSAAAQSLPLYHLTAVPPHRPSALPSSPELTVYLMTMGPGKQVWERFGHNAIWIHDPVRGTDEAYNYGLFDLRQEKFLVRFLQGRMWYWMQGFPAQAHIELYRRANRSVWIQELELPPQARQELQEFLEWNERPENRFYHYDYYRDNCSTRIRDALDRVLGGRIRASTGGQPTGKTYRFHTQRLTANDPFIYTGLLLALGQPVDRPISAWEEMFLPLAMREHLRTVTVRTDAGEKPLVKSERTLFESTEPVPPDRPPPWLPFYLAAGLAIGSTAFGLGRAAQASRLAGLGFSVVAGTWGFVAGAAGLVLAGLWGLTDHTAAYQNENVMQANLLAPAFLWLVPRAVSRPTAARPALMLGGIIAGLSILGLLLKLLPGFDQVNGEIIAFALPAHLGVALGLRQLTRGQGPRIRRIPSLASG